MKATALLVGALLTATLAWSAQSAATLDTSAIENASGLKGTFSKEENVFKILNPRTDLKVAVDGWTMPPFMGLTSWAAFTPTADGAAMMMGDTVLFEDEVNPAMSAALDSGLQVTGLHNHFFFDEPKVYFMHIAGMGDAGKLAAAVKKVYDTIAGARASQPQPQKAFSGANIGGTNAISPEPLEKILGTKGQAKDGMFKVVIGRPASMHGTPVGKEMGINTWAAFAGSDDKAVVDGDFAMTENELSGRCARKASTSLPSTSTWQTSNRAFYSCTTGERPRLKPLRSRLRPFLRHKPLQQNKRIRERTGIARRQVPPGIARRPSPIRCVGRPSWGRRVLDDNPLPVAKTRGRMATHTTDYRRRDRGGLRFGSCFSRSSGNRSSNAIQCITDNRS